MSFFIIKNKIREFFGLKPYLINSEIYNNIFFVIDDNEDNETKSKEIGDLIFSTYDYVNEVLIVIAWHNIRLQKEGRAIFAESKYHFIPDDPMFEFTEGEFVKRIKRPV